MCKRRFGKTGTDTDITDSTSLFETGIRNPAGAGDQRINLAGKLKCRLNFRLTIEKFEVIPVKGISPMSGGLMKVEFSCINDLGETITDTSLLQQNGQEFLRFLNQFIASGSEIFTVKIKNITPGADIVVAAPSLFDVKTVILENLISVRQSSFGFFNDDHRQSIFDDAQRTHFDDRGTVGDQQSSADSIQPAGNKYILIGGIAKNHTFRTGGNGYVFAVDGVITTIFTRLISGGYEP